MTETHKQATQVAAQKYLAWYPHLREADDLRKAISETQGMCGRFSPPAKGCRAFWVVPNEQSFDLCDENHEPYRFKADFEYFLECLAIEIGCQVKHKQLGQMAMF